MIESFFDITPQKKAEQVLREAKEQLEIRVAERTVDLSRANAQLAHELEERRRMEEALRESEERYALAVQGANDGLWDWNLQTDQVYYSPRWKAILGCNEDAVSDRPNEWLNRVQAEDLAQLQAALAAHIEGESAHFESEYRIQTRDGTYRWMLCRGLAIRNADGKAYRIAGSQQCDEMQGFLFSRPVPARKVTELLQESDKREFVLVAAKVE